MADIEHTDKQDYLTLVLSASSLTNYQICGMRYHYSHNLRLNFLHRPSYFDNGTMMHEMLAHYYRQKLELPFDEFRDSEAQIIEDCLAIGVQIALVELELDTPDIEKNKKTFQDYLKKYENDNFVPLAVEVPFSKELITLDELKLRILVEGKIDLIGNYSDSNTRAVMDHKTMSRRSDPHPLNNQWRVYSWAVDIPLVIINQIGYQKSVDGFHRPSVSYSQEQIDEFVQDTITWALRMHESNLTNNYLRNPSACESKYGHCLYTDLCNSFPATRERKMVTLYKKGDRSNIYE